MNTRPTPETDKIIRTQLNRVEMTATALAANLTVECGRFECERDEARFNLEFCRRLGDQQNETINDIAHARDEWKAKFIQQNKDLGCEMMDPNGTIWDHAQTLQRERDEAREQRDRLAAALQSVKCELGVPQPEYPSPVANAYWIADEALQSITPNEINQP